MCTSFITLNCNKCSYDNKTCGMGLAYRDGSLQCPKYEKKKQTNFDRIRKMSIEELADFIDYSIWEDEDFNKIINQKVLYGLEEVKQWLESEVDTE